MTREEAAIALGAALGWDVIRDIGGHFSGWGIGPKEIVEQDGFIGRYERWTRNVSLPAPDAPLHEHLAFVGRVAEALNAFPTVTCGNVGKRAAEGYRVQYEAHVAFDMPHIVDGVCYGQASADDTSHAAMLAAIEARRGR